jgi:leucyl-tRNA synthetase
MELYNALIKAREQGAAGSSAWEEALDLYLLMMAPITPHVAEELWSRRGKPYSIHLQSWPAVDEAAAAEEEITLVVQVNGKVRDRLIVPVTITQDEVKALALASETIQKILEGKSPKKVILVPGKLVNIVI